MKLKVFLFFTLLTANRLFSQQNFFNVPSSDITPKGKVFFQQQFNLFLYSLQSNTTLDFGLGKGFEIGLNYNGFTLDKDPKVHLIFNGTRKPYTPFFLLNAQKRFTINEKIGVAVGGQIGATTTRKFRLGGYAYSNFIYREENYGFKLVSGLYYASNSYFGKGDRFFNKYVGLQLGLEKSIIKEKLLLQADFFSGQHNVGEVVLGAAYFVSKEWILSAGYQIPTFESASNQSFVMELTYSPSAETVAKVKHIKLNRK